MGKGGRRIKTVKIRVKLRGKLGILCSSAKLHDLFLGVIGLSSCEFRVPFYRMSSALRNDPKNIYNIT